MMTLMSHGGLLPTGIFMMSIGCVPRSLPAPPTGALHPCQQQSPVRSHAPTLKASSREERKDRPHREPHDGEADPSALIPHPHLRFWRFSTSSVTTVGSASVEVS